MRERDTASILALAPDLFFGARLADSARALGRELRRVSTPAALLEELGRGAPALVLVDLAVGVERLEEIAAHAGEARLVAFGPHKDAESLAAARAAGFHEVVPNSRMAREGAALLARHLTPEDVRESTRGGSLDPEGGHGDPPLPEMPAVGGGAGDAVDGERPPSEGPVRRDDG